jgi:Domain of unknown function (DUF1992)
MFTQDELIAEHLQDALAKGELQSIRGFGKPLGNDPDWEATPVEFRMAFKILKDSGFVPPEVDMFNRRAALKKQIDSVFNSDEKVALMRELSTLEQSISLRLEAMRSTGNV